MKKTLITLGGIVSTVAPIIAVISCGSHKTPLRELDKEDTAKVLSGFTASDSFLPGCTLQTKKVHYVRSEGHHTMTVTIENTASRAIIINANSVNIQKGELLLKIEKFNDIENGNIEILQKANNVSIYKSKYSALNNVQKTLIKDIIQIITNNENVKRHC